MMQMKATNRFQVEIWNEIWNAIDIENWNEMKWKWLCLTIVNRVNIWKIYESFGFEMISVV